MKAKNMKKLIFIASLFLAVSPGLFGNAHAGTPVETLCWQDNYGDIWVISYDSFYNDTFGIHGYTISSTFCNGTNVAPITGTAVIVGDNVVLGVWQATNSPGCVGVSYQINIDYFTSIGYGWGMNQTGVQGNISVFPVSCPF